MAQCRGQFTIPPGGVRNQEIEKPPFFAGILLFEKPLGVLRQFYKVYAVFEIGLVSALVPFDVAQAAFLVDTPLSGHFIEEGGADGAIELIDVGGVDSILEPVIFCLKPFNRLIMLPPLINMAVVEGVTHPVEDLVIEHQTTEERAEFFFQHLFANIGLVAFPFIASAMIVNVLLLLDLADNRASAMTAGD